MENEKQQTPLEWFLQKICIPIGDGKYAFYANVDFGKIVEEALEMDKQQIKIN
jgi:hypothetical protein